MLHTPKYYTQQQATYQWRVWTSGEHGAGFGLSTNGVRLLILFDTFSPSLTLKCHYSLIFDIWTKQNMQMASLDVNRSTFAGKHTMKRRTF